MPHHAVLRGDADFEENLAKYHRCRKAKKPKADAARVSSARALAGENGDRDRKREGGENGDRDRKGGDRAQQQVAGREGGQSSGRARGAAARRRRGQDDAATIAATTNISRFSSVRDRVEKANGMTVLQAITLNIYTLRTLRSDESAGYITLGRTSDISARDTDGDDLRSAGIWMDGDDFFMSNPMDDFSD